MENVDLLNKHPLVGLCVVLVLIDRFHQKNHTSLMCECHAMRHVPELDWVVSQNVEHRWRMKSASLGFLSSMNPDHHEVVLIAMDWGWCITSFGRQLDKLLARAPPGCDLAYNVLQQVQMRCTRCGSPPGGCTHTGSQCEHQLPASAPTASLLDAARALTDSFQCRTSDGSDTPSSQWTASATDLPKPRVKSMPVAEHPCAEQADEEQSSAPWWQPSGHCQCGSAKCSSAEPCGECSMVDDNVDGSAEPCSVTAFVTAGLISERVDCMPDGGHAVTLGDVVNVVSGVLSAYATMPSDDSCVLKFVWGPNDNAFEIGDATFLRERFLLHSDGKVQCGRLLESKGGGRISAMTDSFEIMVLARLSQPGRVQRLEQEHRGPTSDAVTDADLPLERGIARVDRHSWRKLQPGQWFDDELCNAFLAQVNASCSRAYCVPTHFMSSLAYHAVHMPHARLAALFIPGCVDEPAFWSRHQMLLVPLHIAGSHWALITMDVRLSENCITLTSYDSWRAGRQRDATAALSSELRRFVEGLGWQGRIEEHVSDDCPQQHNNDDCGPCMLLVACLLAMGQDANSHRALFGRMDEVRVRIGTVIKAGLTDLAILTGQ